MWGWAPFAVILLTAGITAGGETGQTTTAPVRILALGDSYTIGEGVAPEERWPMQLAEALRRRGLTVAEPSIVARTGWTTDELAAGIHAAEVEPPFDLVTLMIGVNNQYRGREVEELEEQLAQLVGRAVTFAGDRPDRVVVVSIPDWGVTPFARGRDTARVGREVDAFNAATRQVAERHGCRFVDVTGRSRMAGAEPAMLTEDGLHPSGRQYSAWVEAIEVEAVEALAG